MTTSSISPIVVRKAKVEDAAQVSEVGRHVFSITFGHSVTPEQLAKFLDETYTPELIGKEIQDPTKLMLVAEDPSGRIAGFILMARESDEPCVRSYDKRVEMLRFYVHTDYHGQGVGKALSIELEKIARAEGQKYMWLGVWEENHKAQAVYRKMGYEKVGDHVFDVGGDLQTDEIMIKQL
ncbi:acyl-CoA N-acyltransferase [Elsinoe ampelina]|uniref:Acyl-CoA N-acyltransferase n=1 Tax=Elsinoe ampelina TaxID=302913 RepID=A0A6A6FZI7_9PEZI|nr:acyl-CoA N-acyltransferase [Elsinoe ampelina]